MYGLFLILNDIYKLDVIHELFYDEELGATTIDSQGMGKVLLDHNVHVPMLASMRKLIDGRKPYNKLVFSVVREEDKLRRIVKKIKKELDNFSEPGIGFLFVVPVMECYGSKVECGPDDELLSDEEGHSFI
jgi:nitrogen regulatory protein PII